MKGAFCVGISNSISRSLFVDYFDDSSCTLALTITMFLRCRQNKSHIGNASIPTRVIVSLYDLTGLMIIQVGVKTFAIWLLFCQHLTNMMIFNANITYYWNCRNN